MLAATVFFGTTFAFLIIRKVLITGIIGQGDSYLTASARMDYKADRIGRSACYGVQKNCELKLTGSDADYCTMSQLRQQLAA